MHNDFFKFLLEYENKVSLNAWECGHDSAKSNIADFCRRAIIDNKKTEDDWQLGYNSALKDVLQCLERM